MRIQNKTSRFIFLLMMVFVSQVSLASIKICSVSCLVSHENNHAQSENIHSSHMQMIHADNQHHDMAHMTNSQKQDCCGKSCHCEKGIFVAKVFKLSPEIALQKRPQVAGFHFINQIHSNSFITSIYKPPIFNS